MNRAERRRLKRKQERQPTYNFNQEQLHAMTASEMADVIEAAKKDTINTAMTLLLTLPLEVLMNYYWPKTYRARLPEFVRHVLDYYQAWQDGELDLDELKGDLWEFGGIRLEEKAD